MMFCWHRWRVSAVQHEVWVPKWALELAAGKMPSAGNKTTNILYRCDKCGAIKTNEIEGHWEKEQL